jgi:hypothetical protein
MPPASLTASTASWAAFAICWPSAAFAPVRGCSAPIMTSSTCSPVGSSLPPAALTAEPEQAASVRARPAIPAPDQARILWFTSTPEELGSVHRNNGAAVSDCRSMR